MHTLNDGNDKNKEPGGNSDKQGVDKAPGEERGNYDQVTTEDLKGKKVDADPSREEEKPAQQ